MLSAIASVRLLRPLFVTGIVFMSLLLCLLGINRAFADSDEGASPDALGSIAGVVRDQQGAPVAGIKLSVYRLAYYYDSVRVVTTTVTGEYKVPFLPAGLYRLQASDANKIYGAVYYQQSSTSAGATDVAVAGNHVTGIDFTLSPAAYITGIATILTETVATGGYVALYAKVDEFWQFVDSTNITSTGAYTIGPLPPDIFRVCATAYFGLDSFVGCYGGGITPDAAADLPLAAGETKTNVNIATGLEQYNGAITGAVTANGAPLAGIRVAVSPYSGGPLLVYTMTNASGGYTLGGLSDGYYYVEFADPNQSYATVYYENQRSWSSAKFVSIEDNAVVSNVNASMLQAGIISGIVRLSNGQPVAEAEVYLYYKQNRYGYDDWVSVYPISRTDQQGQFTGRLLWPDTYHLCVYSSRFSYSECYGSPTDYYSDIFNAQDLVLQPGGVISGVNMILGPDVLFYLPVIAQ